MRKPSRLALRAERQLLLRLWRQHQADLWSWRRTLRPCFLHLFAQRAATLRWSRTLLTLLVDELQTDDRFFELVGDLRYLPVRQYPRAIAIAILGLAAALSRLSASLRPRSGLAALTAAAVEPHGSSYVMARQSARAQHGGPGRDLPRKGGIQPCRDCRQRHRASR